MKTIRVSVSIGLVGCRRESTIEVDPESTDEEIEEEAREALFNLIEWGWQECEPVERKRRRP